MIWSELERIFSHASDLPAGERAAYLDETCAGDPDARAEIEAMLAADQTAYEMDLERRLLPEADLGQTVGPYRIVEPLGEGGMSSVFVAERADGAYEHRVALKIVGSGIGEAEMGRRFRQERQILARLQHPNIARLLDGGGTGTGRPYLVMELVDGEPITTYCDRHRLSVNERLRLFMAVAQTVQYAHQNLIVHRDLKPSNILVTETGRVKLLDFGIAKLLDPGEGELLQTGAEHRLLTPAYAAPEQIRGDAITTATDVYALGLLLYELLSGHRPFKAGETSSRRDLESMILDAEPERPSDAIHRTGDTAVTTAVIAEARGIDSDQLHARLQGDLDTIVRKALRKEPEQRYGSAERLADDVRRHLEHLPIAAREPTAGYRLRKFVSRHRVGAAITALGLVLTVFFMTALIRQQAETARERDRAQLESAKSEQVTEFLVGLFRMSDPGQAAGETVTARSLLDEGAQRAGIELADQPDVQATLLGAMTEAYQGLGLLEPAEATAQQALALRSGLSPAQLADAEQRLAGVYHDLSRHEAADSLFALATERYEPGSADIPNAIAHRAYVVRQSGDTERADSLYTLAFAQFRARGNTDSAGIAEAMTGYGLLLQGTSDYDRATTYLDSALTINRALHGDLHPTVAEATNALVLLNYERGTYDQAEPLAEDHLRMQQRLNRDETHPNVLSAANNLAMVYWRNYSLAAADSMFSEVLRLRRQYYEEDNVKIGISLLNKGAVQDVKGDSAGAEGSYREALALFRRLFDDDDNVYVAVAMNNVAQLIVHQDRFDEAEQLYLESLRIRRVVYGDESRSVANVRYNIAEMQRKQGRHAEAIETFDIVIDVCERVLPDDLALRADALAGLGQTYLVQGQPAAAEEPLRAAQTLYAELWPDGHPDRAIAESVLAEALIRQDQHAAAEPLLRTSLATLESAPGNHTGAIADVKRRLRMLEG